MPFRGLGRLLLGFAAAVVATVTLVARPHHVRDRTPQVFTGCPGWLFLADELSVPANGPVNLARHIELIGRVARFLEPRRIALVIVVVPDKSRVEAKSLCGRTRAPQTADRLPQTIADLRAANIRVVDLLPALAAVEDDAYYRTDSHWSQQGAAHAAEAVAAALQGWGLAPTQRAEFHVSTAPPYERQGDLYTLAGLARLPAALRPPADSETDTTIRQSAPPGTGLLDDTPPPELVLIGTSFSQVGKFGEFLALSLGSPVDSRAIAGGNLIGSAKAYFASSDFAASPPRVIVWEMPERIVQSPLSREEVSWSRNLSPDEPADKK